LLIGNHPPFSFVDSEETKKCTNLLPISRRILIKCKRLFFSGKFVFIIYTYTLFMLYYYWFLYLSIYLVLVIQQRLRWWDLQCQWLGLDFDDSSTNHWPCKTHYRRHCWMTAHRPLANPTNQRLRTTPICRVHEYITPSNW